MDIDDTITKYEFFMRLVKNNNRSDVDFFFLRDDNHAFRIISKVIKVALVLQSQMCLLKVASIPKTE